ncbi:MAG: RNA polymerase sigma factor [Limisphaerales bacterium]
MMTNELLRRYAADGSEPAFTELVRQHIDLVYSAALRQVNGDASAAQDVTQEVFTDLAHKASRLAGHASLTGWLYTSVRFQAAKARRAELRRQASEHASLAMNELLQTPDMPTAWLELRPVLDDVMHELNETDREAVLLRYFERKPLAEVGARLGLSENAARMRVDRALEKLRAKLSKRGITSTAAALAPMLAERAVDAAPVPLVAKVSKSALRSRAKITVTVNAILCSSTRHEMRSGSGAQLA